MSAVLTSQGRKRSQGLSAEELQEMYPSLRELAQPTSEACRKAWIAAFTLRPDAMYALIADIIKQVHAVPGRTGQRPMPREEEVDFESLMWGEENDLPLTDILPKLMNQLGLSERAVVSRISMSRTQFRRMFMTGTDPNQKDYPYEPDVNELRELAHVVKRPPMFFVEYRKAMAMAAFINLIELRPGIATKLYRDYLTIRMSA